MSVLRQLKDRHRQPEVMDQPGLDAGGHQQALDALARINWISASSLMLWPPIRRLCRERLQAGDGRPVRVLDVASGGGDIAIRMWRRARRKGIALEVAGCDFSPFALEHARKRAAARRADVSFFTRDVIAEPIPAGYDVVTCSLFLHHLDEADAVSVLAKMRDAAGQMVLVNDLNRSKAGWLAAYFGSRALTRSPVVHVDALLSVEAAFTPAEALELARRAGMAEAEVRSRFPFRYLLSWRRT
ncbi:MAG TPA: methyltransferase domain-containing protein [Gemmataceae bacterium]|nr:methyltransferase domain-containing protein [Gemmataceae bacterium]